MDGSTAVFVMLKNNRLMLGHTGDTRAVLCRGKKAIELTSDHKPDRQDEQERSVLHFIDPLEILYLRVLF